MPWLPVLKIATNKLLLLILFQSSALMAEQSGSSFYVPATEPNRPRNETFFPLVSLLLPGFDQWYEGQTTAGALYTGVAVGGVVYAASQSEDLDKDDKENQDRIDSQDIVQRKTQYGLQLYQTAGGLSAYHSFRTAVTTRPNQYGFLKSEDTPKDILLAPFEFNFLTRPSTFVPLAIAGTLAAVIATKPPRGHERDAFTQADAFFAPAFSYNAGTHEEAFFRGYVMPAIREHSGNDFWSNAGQSTLFALAHLGSTNVPVAQLLLGFHLGNVTQNNQWSLRESIFIHTWWDVIVFAASYSVRKQDDKSNVVASLHLPPLELRF
jgi:membrane protease YdiL (CAAX protease family)